MADSSRLRPWKTLSSRPVYESRWMRVREDVAEMPDEPEERKDRQRAEDLRREQGVAMIVDIGGDLGGGGVDVRRCRHHEGTDDQQHDERDSRGRPDPFPLAFFHLVTPFGAGH